MKYIDLSHTIKDGMPVYPEDIKVNLIEDKSYEIDKYTSYILKTGLHAGTHIDCPMHLTEDKRYISDFSVDNFVGEAVLIDVRDEKNIIMKDEYKELLNNKEIVIIYTGFEKKYGTNEYYENHPILSEDFTEYLIERKIKIIGMDAPSPDRYPFKIHKKLLGNNILILENLCNLDNLLNINKFQIIALPLKLSSEASLVRAIAVQEQS